MTIATALIASQAVLCAVIGWVTFGGKEQSGGSAARAAEPKLGPALVVPPVSVAPVIPVPSSHQSPKPSASSSATIKPSRSTPPPVKATLPRSHPAETTAVPPKPPATGPADGAVVARPTPSASEVQGNVVIGDECDPEGADGVTAIDIAVTCLPDHDGDLIWQIG